MTDGMIAALALIGIVVLATGTYQWINYLNRRNSDKER